MNRLPELPPRANERGPSGDPITYDQAQDEIDRQAGPETTVRNDPAFGPPGDPLTRPGVRARAEVVARDIPIVVVQNSWGVDQARAALAQHMVGVFERSGQLCDSVLGDDRVIATLGSRRAGLFGREIRFKAANDSAAAKEVLEAWIAHWPQFAGDGQLAIMNDYEVLMGWSDAQLVWDTGGKTWLPYLRHFHPRYEYWHFQLRKMMAVTQDRQIPITGGDGKWVHHSRFGSDRCWIRGAIRAITEPYLGRHWSYRDFMRWCEKHGLATVIAEVPMASDPGERAQFAHQVANLGSESTVMLGKGVDADSSYGLRLLEAQTLGWEGFVGARDMSDMAIVLALLFQNLTTEVKGGSFAATDSHMDIRDSGIQEDNGAWRSSLMQVSRPFAYFNYGDASLAPVTEWDVASRKVREANARQWQAFGTGLEGLARGGIKFKNANDVRKFAAEQFGLYNLPDFEIGDPPQAGGASGGSGDSKKKSGWEK
jgi:hypothetical protein